MDSPHGQRIILACACFGESSQERPRSLMEDPALEPRPQPCGEDVGVGEEADRPHGPAGPQSRQAGSDQAGFEVPTAEALEGAKSACDRTQHCSWVEEGVQGSQREGWRTLALLKGQAARSNC